jgi:hypothetical protein
MLLAQVFTGTSGAFVNLGGLGHHENPTPVARMYCSETELLVDPGDDIAFPIGAPSAEPG